jgi:hypothetical protein
MISVSSSPISVSVDSEKFLAYFNSIENIFAVFECKPVRHLKVLDNKLSFILKRVSQFELELSKEINKNWVQYNSTAVMLFQSAVRFHLNTETNEITIHIETDTNQFMELFLEKRLTKLLEHLSKNIKHQLN